MKLLRLIPFLVGYQFMFGGNIVRATARIYLRLEPFITCLTQFTSKDRALQSISTDIHPRVVGAWQSPITEGFLFDDAGIARLGTS